MRFGMRQPECCLTKNSQAGMRIERPRCKLLSQVLCFYQFHDQVETIIVAFGIIIANDVGVLQSPYFLSFLFKRCNYIL